MNRLKLYLLALTALIVCSAKADEGMWLLQLMQQQHSIDMMKKQLRFCNLSRGGTILQNGLRSIGNY